jgi:hypothetical protein
VRGHDGQTNLELDDAGAYERGDERGNHLCGKGDAGGDLAPC